MLWVTILRLVCVSSLGVPRWGLLFGLDVGVVEVSRYVLVVELGG